jgi:hypothetical protein
MSRFLYKAKRGTRFWCYDDLHGGDVTLEVPGSKVKPAEEFPDLKGYVNIDIPASDMVEMFINCWLLPKLEGGIDRVIEEISERLSGMAASLEGALSPLWERSSGKDGDWFAVATRDGLDGTEEGDTLSGFGSEESMICWIAGENRKERERETGDDPVS